MKIIGALIASLFGSSVRRRCKEIAHSTGAQCKNTTSNASGRCSCHERALWNSCASSRVRTDWLAMMLSPVHARSKANAMLAKKGMRRSEPVMRRAELDAACAAAWKGMTTIVLISSYERMVLPKRIACLEDVEARQVAKRWVAHKVKTMLPDDIVGMIRAYVLQQSREHADTSALAFLENTITTAKS